MGYCTSRVLLGTAEKGTNHLLRSIYEERKINQSCKLKQYKKKRKGHKKKNDKISAKRISQTVKLYSYKRIFRKPFLKEMDHK